MKYVVLAPWVIQSVYSYLTTEEIERDITNLLIIPYFLWRLLHGQLWISLARCQTSKTKRRILDKNIEFEQVDRERNWDDQIILNAILYYLGFMYLPGTSRMPLWRWDGLVLTILLHMGPVEFIYYWFHRALHHHFLYSRYHSHHHSSIVTEPITAVIHPFAEHVGYFLLFSIPLLSMLFTGTASAGVFTMYATYIDFMNYMGHCNFELVPKWVFNIFPVLKYLMYTPSFHSLHHTQFRTNYALFMPFYDYIYGTVDKSSDKLYEDSLRGREETTDVVAVVCKDNFDKLKLRIPTELWSNLILSTSTSYTQKVWLVGDGELSKKEQIRAPEGTHFLPCTQFPPQKVRKDCIYYSTPAMLIPKALQNVYSCENWLPRRVMSAWRVAGIVHALEGWTVHECGDTMLDIEKVWSASLCHGFRPMITVDLKYK
ncbi:hypothetical protein NE237_030413 [Protea cynaroides]|uniref:Fatty acid hydroxylase domain-containing protein n=1 Tax=Protea cynaroides TaxID=273540 RepID=A0A9Q0JVR8_9MAGN|nr:hypothetical protein NE237_030413 [Protea cynaroides]